MATIIQSGTVTTSGTGAQFLAAYTVPNGRTLYLSKVSVDAIGAAWASTNFQLGVSVTGTFVGMVAFNQQQQFLEDTFTVPVPVAGNAIIYVYAANWAATINLQYIVIGNLV